MVRRHPGLANWVAEAGDVLAYAAEDPTDPVDEAHPRAVEERGDATSEVEGVDEIHTGLSMEGDVGVQDHPGRVGEDAWDHWGTGDAAGDG